MEFKNSYAVIAAPQYLLGNYLNCDIMRAQLKDIVDNPTEDAIKKLNDRLKSKIYVKGKMNKPTIYIQYSDMEHTYEDHIKYLLSDLHDAGLNVHEEVLHYPNHGDLYMYFPKYLVDTVNEIIEKG